LRQCVETGKYNGHKIRPQLIPVLRQYAEKPQAWGIGFGGGALGQALATSVKPGQSEFDKFDSFMNLVQSIGDTLKGVSESQFALTQQISTLAENFTSQHFQATTPSTQPAENPVQQSVIQQPVIQQLNIAAVGEQIGSMVSQAVAAALKPTQDAQQKLSDRIAQITGKLPD